MHREANDCTKVLHIKEYCYTLGRINMQFIVMVSWGRETEHIVGDGEEEGSI